MPDITDHTFTITLRSFVKPDQQGDDYEGDLTKAISDAIEAQRDNDPRLRDLGFVEVDHPVSGHKVHVS